MQLPQRVRDYFAELQRAICTALEARDSRGRFREDSWQYAPESGQTGGGGGVSRVLTRGDTFEKAGVNIAHVRGELNERLAARLEVEPQPFEASGISLVIHPLSPHVPTVHMNLRFLELRDRAWFGGGADLTPYYLYHEDAAHFHLTLRDACNLHDPAGYARYKRACDEYFYLRHRQETRGVGGIFFDYLSGNLEAHFAFVQEVGQAFLPAYLPIVDRRRNEPWWDRERAWQLLRRGRYVEFNLIYDRGTLFGLETQGRTESILMSLPPLVRWDYDHRPEPGSPEAELVEVLRRPREWI
jgi:coproporphyrinogen III oxidase